VVKGPVGAAGDLSYPVGAVALVLVRTSAAAPTLRAMTAPEIPWPTTPEGWTERGRERLPGLVGLTVTVMERGNAAGRLDVQPHHLAPNGFLHAASVIALADTLAGYGCVVSLPEGASGFTTIEIKSNFLGTVREGGIAAKARLVHGGRTTQVWDAEVVDEANGKTIALFRCTQMVLYPRA
jgi:1,4-dihydroxy-2-naphthoyl-CoA hydrolase